MTTAAPINLKHRITGAVILIGVVVLALPPVFERGTLSPPTSPPSPAASTPSTSTTTPSPPTASPSPAPSVPSAAPSSSASTPSPTSPAASPRWIVRTGAFKSIANAHRMRAEIRKRGFEAWVEEGGGELAWKVWVGSFATQADAGAAQRKLCATVSGACDYFVARR